MNREKLLAARAKALADAQAVVDGAAEGMTAEQLTAVKGFKAAADNLAEQIEAMDGLEAARRKTLTAAPAPEGTPVKVPAKAIDRKAEAAEKLAGYGLAAKALGMTGRNREAAAALEDVSEYGVDFAKKTLTIGTTNAAGFLVHESDVNLFVELYRPGTIVRSNAPPPLAVADGAYWTKQLTDPVANWSEEDDATQPNATTFTGQRVNFTAKKLTTHAAVSQELIRATGGGAGSLILDLLAKAMAFEEDKQFLIGTGTSQKPTGIITAITSTAAASAETTATFALAEGYFKALMSVLRAANEPMAKVVYLTTPELYTILERLINTAGLRAYPELIESGRVGQYGMRWHTNMTAEMLAAVDFSQVVIADFGGMEVKVSDMASYTNEAGTVQSAFMQDAVVYKLVKRSDIQVRNAAFGVRRTGLKWV